MHPFGLCLRRDCHCYCIPCRHCTLLRTVPADHCSPSQNFGHSGEPGLHAACSSADRRSVAGSSVIRHRSATAAASTASSLAVASIRSCCPASADNAAAGGRVDCQLSCVRDCSCRWCRHTVLTKQLWRALAFSYAQQLRTAPSMAPQKHHAASAGWRQQHLLLSLPRSEC